MFYYSILCLIYMEGGQVVKGGMQQKKVITWSYTYNLPTWIANLIGVTSLNLIAKKNTDIPYIILVERTTSIKDGKEENQMWYKKVG